MLAGKMFTDLRRSDIKTQPLTCSHHTETELRLLIELSISYLRFMWVNDVSFVATPKEGPE